MNVEKTYQQNEQLTDAFRFPLNSSLSYRLSQEPIDGIQGSDQVLPDRTPEVVQTFLGDMEHKGDIAGKLARNLEHATNLFESSDVVAVSLDLDGVFFNGYDVGGIPIFDTQKLDRIQLHIRSTRKELAKQGKQLITVINTNREWPMIEPVMEAIDPTATKWAATLEGGHVVAYRDTFAPEEYSTVGEDEKKKTYVTRNGHKALVVKEYGDGSVLAVESLVETSEDLKSIRLGTEQITLAEAREQMVELFEGWIAISVLGEDSYMPNGRMGMVTARNVSEDMVKQAGDTVALKGTVKKYFAHDGSKIVEAIRTKFGLSADSKDWPFDIIYYPDDGGLDIQFKNIDKVSGQKEMVERMRSILGIDHSQKIAILHAGDSGSDEVSGVIPELNAEAVVVAVANAQHHHLIDRAIALTSRPAQRGVAEMLYILRQISMKKVTSSTIEVYRDQHSVGDLIKAYLGRTEPRAGDIDLRRIMKDVDLSQLADAAQLLQMVKARGGRVFVYGNGGSFDNARLIVNFLNEAGINAKTPGSTRVIKQAIDGVGFSRVFEAALEADGFNDKDLVIGISGSGTSPNVLIAHDYAQRIRLKALHPIIQQLSDMGVHINTELLHTTPLSTDPKNVEVVIEAFTKFEQSLNDAVANAKANSDELPLLLQIVQSQNVVSLGGRDGGTMRRLTGDAFTILARTNCMEALEDHNPMIMRAISDQLIGMSIDEALQKATEPLNTIARPEVLDRLVGFATTMERTIFNGGRVIIVGNQHKHPSVTHAEADWGRGMVNMLPISGPNIIIVERNLNALMACANDDGDQYRYADQIGEMQLRPNDLVVFIGDEKDEPAFSIALDEVTETGAQKYIIGHDIGSTKADLPAADDEVDIAATTVIHHMSRAINEHLRSQDGFGWQVEPLNNIPEPIGTFIKQKMGNQRKLNRRDTLALEVLLQQEGLLPDGKVITWCYGKPFAVDTPEKYGLPRGFY